MGKYNSYLKAEFNPPRKWCLTQTLTYTTKDILEKMNLWRMAIDMLKYDTELNDMLCKDVIAPWEEINAFDKTLIDIENGQLIIRVPPGFSTDLASVPRSLWWLISPTDLARAAVIHDFLYSVLRSYIKYYPNLTKQTKKRLRKLCDKVFYYAMLDSRPKIPMWKIDVVYTTVRWFGWSAIKGY
jgi:hypothetical protein